MSATYYYQGRRVRLAKAPADGSAHEVTSAGETYAVPEGHVGVILGDGRVIAADPSQVTTRAKGR